MSSKVLRGDTTGVIEPMPWLTVGDPDAARHATLFEPAPNSSSHRPALSADMAAEFESRLAAMQASMQAAAAREAQQAREAGRREGEAAGRQAAQEEVARAVQELGSAIRRLADCRPALRMEAEGDMVKLALAIARRIVRRELSIDPEAITGLARTALDRLRLQETVSVRIHPHYQESVRRYLAQVPGASHVEVIGDPTLDRGAIVFETARGRLDASADTQFREIESGLADRLRAHHS